MLDKVCFTSDSYYKLATNITSTPAFHLMNASWIIPIVLLQIHRGHLGLGGAQLWSTRNLKIVVDAVPTYTDTPFASFRRSSQLSAWLNRPVAYGLARERERTKPSRGAFSSPSLSLRLSCALTYPFAVLVPSQYPPCQAFRTTPLPSLQICHSR